MLWRSIMAPVSSNSPQKELDFKPAQQRAFFYPHATYARNGRQRTGGMPSMAGSNGLRLGAGETPALSGAVCGLCGLSSFAAGRQLFNLYSSMCAADAASDTARIPAQLPACRRFAVTLTTAICWPSIVTWAS
jgi:hypothetical protein